MPFSFKPSLAGEYLERLTVHDINDASNTRVVQVKATLLRPESFWLQHLNLDFGAVLVNESSRTQTIVLKNISNKERTFEVRASKSGATGETPLAFHKGGIGTHIEAKSPARPPPSQSRQRAYLPSITFALAGLSLSFGPSAIEREERIEQLERKLKIAQRKLKLEKAQVVPPTHCTFVLSHSACRS